MSKVKALSSTEDVKREARKLIKQGYHKAEIKRIVSLRVDENGPNPREIENIVDDECGSFPNYGLIQYIMTSEIVRDLASDGRYVNLLNYKHRTVEQANLATIRSAFGKGFDLDARVRLSKFVYDPFNPFFLDKDESGIHMFNSYNPPSWQADLFFTHGKVKVPKSSGMPEKYKRFLAHLVDGDAPSMEYILDWLANAIQGKNYTILATIGAQGIGKGVLGDIMSGIFQDNFTSTRGPDFFKGRFNSQILNKRMFYINEVEISSVAEEERLKLLIENTIEIEKKGVDAQVYPNFASIYISTNNLDAIKLSGDDRRFSIVNLTSTKLLKVMKPDDIADLTDEKSVEAFARYLYHRKVDPTRMLQVFKSKRTEEVRESALNEWQEFLLYDYGYDHAGKELPIRQVKEDIMSALDNVNYRIGRGALRSLSSRFPEKLKVFQRKDPKTGKPDHFIMLNPEGRNE